VSSALSSIPTLSKDQMFQMLVTAFADAANTPANTDAGSTMGSAFLAVVLLALLIQNNQATIANVARLVTSFNGDVDSFVEPFGFTRIGASYSSGLVTFSTTAPVTNPAGSVIPVGTIVQTSDGTQFTVVADPSQPGYSAADSGYVISQGSSSVNATVTCMVEGSIGNVQANTITTIYNGGIAASSVTNPDPITNGTDQESDVALKARFTLGVSSGHVATNNAYAAAILGVQENLTYSIADQTFVNGTGTAPTTTTTASVTQPTVGTTVDVAVADDTQHPVGSYVLVYDGTHVMYGVITAVGTSSYTIENLASIVSGTIASGATVLFVGGPAFFTVVVNVLGQSSGPSANLLTLVQEAIDAVRTAGILRAVIGPTLVDVNAVATIDVASGYDSAAVIAACQAAYDAYVNNIGLDPAGGTTDCSYGRVYAVLLAVAGVTNVTGLTLNGATTDISAGFAQQLVAGTATFTAG
jgi:hypothetical protein